MLKMIYMARYPVSLNITVLVPQGPLTVSTSSVIGAAPQEGRREDGVCVCVWSSLCERTRMEAIVYALASVHVCQCVCVCVSQNVNGIMSSVCVCVFHTLQQEKIGRAHV